MVCASQLFASIGATHAMIKGLDAVEIGALNMERLIKKHLQIICKLGRIR